MRKLLLASVSLALFMPLAATAQIRGRGRLQGNVVDKNTGKPLAGATVTISLPWSTMPIVARTDSRGHWAALGMSDGVWNIDISAPGYETGRGTARVSELESSPPINTGLEPVVQQQPEMTAPAAPSLPQEVVDAIQEGEQLLRVKAGDTVTIPATQPAAPGAPAPAPVSHLVTADEVKENAKRAAADFEKVLPMIPEDKPELAGVKNQVLQVLAQAYYKAGDVKNAIATFEKLDAADPMPATPDAAHLTREVLLANLYLENGQLERGKALLEKLPASAINDPVAYINIGILFLNKKNPNDAAAYFTKAIALDPKRAESYYYRGLAELQMKRNREAKADFEQVVALAPESPEARDSKQLLASLQ